MDLWKLVPLITAVCEAWHHLKPVLLNLFGGVL